MAGLMLAVSARAELVTLSYESATQPGGPWSPIDLRTLHVNPDGTATVNSPAQRTFYRLRIVGNGQDGSFPVVPVADLPAPVLEVARRHLTLMGGSNTMDGEWSGVVISPFASSVGDIGGRGSSLVELKVISAPGNPRLRKGFTPNSSDDPPVDRGSIVVSLDRSNLPILEFTTEGPTRTEELLIRAAGAAPARILRYGPTFWAAENAKGELIANHGTEPFAIPHSFSNHLSRRFSGVVDTETGQSNMPPNLGIRATHYRSYSEMKKDYAVNPVIETMRKRRAEYARIQWNLEEGVVPPTLTVRVGQTLTLLADKSIDRAVLHWEGAGTLATVTPGRVNGLRVTGVQVGSAPLYIRMDESLENYVLQVLPPGIAGPPTLADSGTFTIRDTEAYAGNWSDQRHYYQLRDGDWCDLVGCGPAALAMLFGWWDARGVPSVFYTNPTSFGSIRDSDAPADLKTVSKRSTLRAAYRWLHDYCDVICSPTSDEGATLPDDLIEGYYDYLFHVSGDIGTATLLFASYGKPLVGYSSSWAYDYWGDDWDESGSKVATGIKNGRPGVIGLGVLWHYAVAYGYIRDNIVVPSPNGGFLNIGCKRYLKCNEGWQGSGPHWYSAHEVFLGLTARIWQKRDPVNP